MNSKVIVIGAGLSGLVLANELLANSYQKNEIIILEAQNRTGGLIRTTREKGYTTEWGPEGLMGGKPGTKKIFSYIESEPMSLPPSIPARYIVHKKKLRKVPHGPLSAIFTSLVPFFGKIRLLFEPFVKMKADDETMEMFVKRRFGKGIYNVVDAVVSGIYGGSAEELSVTYAFPTIKQMELQHGSIVKAGISMLKTRRKMKKTAPPTEKSPFLVKPSGGMQDIIEELSQNVQIKTNEVVNSISVDKNFFVQTQQETYIADQVIVATGIAGASQITVNSISPLEEVSRSLVSILSLGFKKEDFPEKYQGYGFLSPSKENTFVLGVLFTSQLFPNTAPEDEVLLRVYIGGIKHPERATMLEEELVPNVLNDLNQLMGITAKPVYQSVQSHAPNGISQILLNHERFLAWRDNVQSKFPGLYFSGIGWQNIACEKLILEAVALAKQISTDKN